MKTIVVPSTIPSSRFYCQPQQRNRPISECTSEMVRVVCDLQDFPKDCLYLYKISWISIELFAEHIVKMLLKHGKKFTVAEITELMKITKLEVAALATTSIEMSVLLIDRLDSTVLLLHVRNILSCNLTKQHGRLLPYYMRVIQLDFYLNLEATFHRL